MLRPIKRALISVSDKTGLDVLAKFLQSQSVEVISTGGTAQQLRDMGLKVKDISEHTGFPEMLDGRVKTLHPKVHGGLLGRPLVAGHKQAMDSHGIAPIDLVVVNLYPFEATVAKQAEFDECIENIDIGGPSMIRSAAKNHEYVTVVVSPQDYSLVIQDIIANDGASSAELRRKLAAKAFARTAAYDSAISGWFARVLGEPFPEKVTVPATRVQVLRYGENPHQAAALYALGHEAKEGIPAAKQLQGKGLSYNNIYDADAALALVQDFEEPTAAIIKHTNPCGIACGATLTSAYEKALACDPVSAFGGIVAFNREVDAKTAELLSQIFLEVVVAPGFSEEAQAIFSAKKNVRLLEMGKASIQGKNMAIRSITGGLLLQERDNCRITEADVKVVTERAPSAQELKDLLFAFTVCKHVKSNAIVLAKDQATIGVGAGQMSRVDSVRIATIKAKEYKEDPKRAKGAVVASDAFFPFADGLLLAADAGVTAAIQPGGSVRDEEVISAANERGMAMVFTNVRHFLH